MGQVNVTPPAGGGDSSAAAGINLVTVLIVLLVLLVVGWFLFTGPLSGAFGANPSNTNVNVKVEQPAGAPTVAPKK